MANSRVTAMEQVLGNVTDFIGGLFQPPSSDRPLPLPSMVDPEVGLHGRGVEDVTWKDLAAQRELSLGQQSTACESSIAEEQFGQGFYVADPQDLLDQHVAYFLKHHPEICQLRRLERKAPGHYDIDGRDVQVEWQYGVLPGEQGFLIALDGPLRQPFSEYMMMTDVNAEYDHESLGLKASLQSIPRERRLTFGEDQVGYSRLDAMKLAKEQANFREQAATYVQQGREIPDDLLKKYEKKIEVKLGARPGRSQLGASPSKQQAGSAGVAPGQPAPRVEAHGAAHSVLPNKLPPPSPQQAHQAQPYPRLSAPQARTPYPVQRRGHSQDGFGTPQPSPPSYLPPATRREPSQDGYSRRGTDGHQWLGQQNWQSRQASPRRARTAAAYNNTRSSPGSRARTPSVPAGGRRQGQGAPPWP